MPNDEGIGRRNLSFVIRMCNKVFTCEKCGMCCRNADRYLRDIQPKLKQLLPDVDLSFPYEIVDGTCSKLATDNTCSVYEHRPTACNTTIMFQHLQKALDISIEELHEKQKISCLINKGLL